MTKADYSTTQEFLDSLMDFDERPAKVCGQRCKHLDPNNKFKWFPMYCKDFRNCAGCKMRRGKEVRTRVTTACARAEDAGQPWPQWQTMPEAETPAFKQKLNRRGLLWWCAPVAGDRAIVFHDHTKEDLGSRIVTVQDIAKEQGLDWERIALTPLHKRTSGKLGKPIEEPRPEDAILVELIAVNQPMCLTKAQVETCEIKAREATADLDPTVDEAVEMCKLVTKALQVELENAAAEYYILQGDDQDTALLNAFRDTPLTTIKRYWSPSSFEPWSNDITSISKEPLDDNRSRYSTRAVPGVDFTPAPVELML